MLLIREDQLEMFRRRARARFDAELARHFLATYPYECREAGGEAAVLELVRRGVDRAAEHGYTTQNQAGLYIGLTFMLGVDFDSDPQIPWAGRGLDDESVEDPQDRILRLHTTAVDYLRATAGDGCRHLVRALVRIKAFDLGTVAEPRGESWEADLLKRLRAFFPEKYDFQGEEANRALVRQAGTVAEELGFEGNRAVTAVGALMFMLGSGFDHDPLHPWAARALEGGGEELERVDRLHREAIAHLERSLASGKPEGEGRP
jgi:hypothetical protein